MFPAALQNVRVATVYTRGMKNQSNFSLEKQTDQKYNYPETLFRFMMKIRNRRKAIDFLADRQQREEIEESRCQFAGWKSLVGGTVSFDLKRNP